MLTYSLIILISSSIIAGLNIWLNPHFDKWYWYIVVEVILIIACFIIDAVVAIMIRKMPAKLFDFRKKRYNPSQKELAFYKKIKVNKWKSFVPELGGFTDFHKDKLTNPYDNTYVQRFLLEACYGIDIHLWSVPFSFLILLLDYKMYSGQSNLWLTMAIPTAVVNAFLIVLPAFILKYNMPRLVTLYEFNVQREQMKAKLIK